MTWDGPVLRRSNSSCQRRLDSTGGKSKDNKPGEETGMATDLRAAELAARLQRIPTSRVSWNIVLLAAGALIVEALDIGSLSIILPSVKSAWHLTPAQVG